MRRPLSVFLPVGDEDAGAVLDRFLEDPHNWLGENARHAGPDAWRIDVRGAGIDREVECRIGPPWVTGRSAWRSIEWRPTESPGDLVPVQRVLPRLRGELGVAREGATTSLVLNGDYEVPASFLGVAADAAGLNRIARRTATRFLARIRDALTETARAAV